MILKNYEIIEAVDSIRQLLNMKIPSIKLNYNLNKNLVKLEPSYKAYSASETSLVEKYVTKNENGTIKMTENKQPDFGSNITKYLTDRNELLDEEDNVDISPIKLSLFPDDLAEGILLHGIMFLIEDDL